MFHNYFSDFILDNKDRDTLSPWKPWLIDGLTFPHHVLRIFYSNLGIIMDTESLEEMYKSLSILQAGKQSQEEILQVLQRKESCKDVNVEQLPITHFI